MSIYAIHTKYYEDWKDIGIMFLVESDSEITAAQEFIQNYFVKNREEPLDEDEQESFDSKVTLEDYQEFIYDTFTCSFEIMDTSPKVTKLFTGFEEH